VKHYVHWILRHGEIEPQEVYTWLPPKLAQELCEGWAEVMGSQNVGWQKCRDNSQCGVMVTSLDKEEKN
jgi:hypothetical protein